MKKIFSIAFAILLSILIIYIFLLSPSQDETNGDQSFSQKEFRKAVVFYTRALANNKTLFSEERILFKLGNSYRLFGEHERAFDFYFSILRKNENSVYKGRIQSYLRHQAKDLEMDRSLGDIELKPISPNDAIDESLPDLKLRRDKIYLKLLNSIVESKNGAMDYLQLDLYDNYRNIQTRYTEKRQAAISQINVKLERKISKKIVSLWMDRVGISDLSTLTDRYILKHMVVENWSQCFNIKEESPVDAFFIYVSEEVHTDLSIQLPRLYDFHEKAKVFLVFDDNTLKTSLYESVKALDDSVSLLQCGEDSNCANVIRQLIHRRSLWQSDG